MSNLNSLIDSFSGHSCTIYRRPELGLTAFLVIDSTALGPAAGGIRTWAYKSSGDALCDAMDLARSMTIKCAIAGLQAGGAKLVIMNNPELQREAAFGWLGLRIEELNGLFRTAGDIGTGLEDLRAVARGTQYVSIDEGDLCSAVGETVYRCIEACAEFRGLDSLSGLSIAVQGCGDIGSAVARKLASQGMQILLADIDAERAESLAREIDGKVVSPDLIFTTDVDIIAPCARGRVITSALAQEISAWVICGGANNILQHDDLEDILRERNILFVPDVLSSSGAVIAGMSREVMGLTDHSHLIGAIGELTNQILREANEKGERTTVLTERIAKERITKVENINNTH